MNKKYWIIGLLVVAAGVLLWFLLRDPKQPDSHKLEHDRIVAINKAFQKREDSLLRRSDSLERSGRSKDSVIASLKAEKKATQKEADKYAASATRLAREVKDLRKGDTSEFAHKCDSLAEQAASFAFLYEQYKNYSDSLTAKMDSRDEDYVKALEERRKLYYELKTKYTTLYDSYTTLFVDYTKVQKTVRRERLKTKIAALLALVGGAAAVFK
jgi:uncharacterized protein Yka (UPF0111/DUF47 family)